MRQSKSGSQAKRKKVSMAGATKRVVLCGGLPLEPGGPGTVTDVLKSALPGAALASCASGGMSPKSTASEMTSTSAPCGTVNSPRWRREPRCVAPGGLAG